MKDSPQAPAPPDPKATAEAQGAMNADTARLQAQLNRFNTNTPYYSQTWSQAPGGGGPQYDYDAYNKALTDYSGRLQGSQGQYVDVNGNPTWQAGTPAGAAPTLEQYRRAGDPQSDQWTTNYTLTPAGQETFEQQQGIQRQLSGIAGTAADRVQSTLGSDFNPNLPALQSQIDPQYQQSGQQVTDALMARLNPQLERDREALITRTLNTGHTPGSPGYNEALDQFGRQSNDARMQAILAAGPEQSRLFGLGLNAAQFGNQARNQSLQEQVYQRNLPLNETTALLSGSQVQMPNIQGTQGIGVQPVDYSSLVNNQYLGQIANNNAEIAGNNAMTQGLFGLGGTIAGFPVAGVGGAAGGSLGGNFLSGLFRPR